MEDLAELQTDINNAKHIAFLTGAGVSTHSGIPDYRSKKWYLQWRPRKPRNNFK